ncbi:MAG: twin-arginine translocase TatA/TatE family subunit [Deltaproteobacteria bacterium]|nr:twin-arginine translocase TatA/TatE family subunit [Deltaproteobacteria bacterium]
MFGLSGEHLLILAAVLLIFGPRKLPELGASIGKALKNFKEGLNSPPSSGQLEARNATASERAEGATFERAFSATAPERPFSATERATPEADDVANPAVNAAANPAAEAAAPKASVQNPAAPTA